MMHEQPTDKNAKPLAVGDNIATQSTAKKLGGEDQFLALTGPEAPQADAQACPKAVSKGHIGHGSHRDLSQLEGNNKGEE
ncbi:uncharacterized protein B0I36DRAFT_334537 [Microdochium trichocladiopsis]|uniref:Uncharacterized protein n=1 Tax=Microdochium trichocladiopsis TaxID=1682393 RepID=A0A9P8XY08_9PEZI|nr:uncharacterized protein B0I36DRAFT_334537 [Microdochium trichocladiopsis]KAH7021497.1 hypothetical protein B0I36DRAFT_334537 [Microdochium trichocladiopsis]